MSKVITFSRTFPAYHPKAGQPTHFVVKLINSLNEMKFNFDSALHPKYSQEFIDSLNPLIQTCKHHTIREGNRWKVGDKFSPRVWGFDVNPISGRTGPYQSKQIIIAPDIEIVKLWDFEIKDSELSCVDTDLFIDGKRVNADMFSTLSGNDGLEFGDFLAWFQYPKTFSGQIICWNENINY